MGNPKVTSGVITLKPRAGGGFGSVPYDQPSYSPYALEILQPQSGLDTKNRFYKQYPGIEYNVSVAAVGGTYPYTYQLLVNPSGMLVDSNTGIISWPDPIENVIPYAVTVQVTDSLGAITQVAWTITVTTSLFMFVDFLNGTQGATGSIGDPVKDVVDVYGGTDASSKTSGVNKDKFIYYRGGPGQDYTMNGYKNGDNRVQWTQDHPMVMMAYPGEIPNFDFSTGFLWGNDTQENMYVDGFDITKISDETVINPDDHFGFKISGGSSNVTFRGNSFNDFASSPDSFNQAVIMAAQSGVGENWAIINNSFDNIRHGYGIVGYSVKGLLFGGNTLNNFYDPEGQGSSHPIGPKVGCNRWTIRGNSCTNCLVDGIWVYNATNDIEQEFGDFEISFNYSSSPLALSFNQKYVDVILPFYIFRNTFDGECLFYNINSISSTVNFDYNVVVSSSGDIDIDGSTPEQVQQAGNIKGTAADNIIDSNGDLLPPYNSQVGIVGWQI